MDVSQGFEGLQQEIEEGFGDKIVSLRRDIHREPELGFAAFGVIFTFTAFALLRPVIRRDS